MPHRIFTDRYLWPIPVVVELGKLLCVVRCDSFIGEAVCPKTVKQQQERVAVPAR